MAKFRKKPVEIEAVKWDGHEVSEVTSWIAAALNQPVGQPGTIIRMGDKVIICTLEGDMVAMPGDYIIRGIKGELYPCKPDIFENSYDIV